jgi:hypothetical protein
MATLVLTTLGTALGGPIGGALGSIIGQSIDQNLFGPPARRGPRLDDLRVQASSYGAAIPRIYGRMRVAGTVVWASDLREEEVVSGGGKGAPGAITYAYSASFAVALSSRPAQSIGRIWADGKLLRGADGTFKSKVTHRFHPGSEAQPVDPLIASIEGLDGSPAFRGLALCGVRGHGLGRLRQSHPVADVRTDRRRCAAARCRGDQRHIARIDRGSGRRGDAGRICRAWQ